MTPSKIIYRAMNGADPVYTGDTICKFCGMPAERNAKRYIKPTFTDIHFLGPGDGVCTACVFALDDRRGQENTMPSCRKMSAIYTLHGYHKFDALSAFELMMDPQKAGVQDGEPFLFFLNYSKKKHLFYKARVSFSTRSFWVQTDNIGFMFSPDEWKDVANMVQELYSYSKEEAKKKNPMTYFTKAEILSLMPSLHRIEKFGANRFFAIKESLMMYKSHPAYEAIVYGIRPKDDNDDRTKNGRQIDTRIDGNIQCGTQRAQQNGLFD